MELHTSKPRIKWNAQLEKIVFIQQLLSMIIIMSLFLSTLFPTKLLI